jgi:hypothetical protein
VVGYQADDLVLDPFITSPYILFFFCIMVLDIPGFHNGTAFGGEQ